MRNFNSIIGSEWKRFWRPRNIVLGIIFLVLSLYLIFAGISQYNELLKTKEHFKEIERQKVEKYHDYNHYGNYGFRILLYPSNLSILFYNSGKFIHLISEINVSERLDLDISINGKGMFRENPFPYADFSGVFFIFGTLMVLLYGLELSRQLEYLKHLSLKIGINKVYLKAFIARYLIINLLFMALIILAVLVITIWGISLSGADLLLMAAFFGFWLLTSFIMMGLGAIVGFIKRLGTCLITALVAWIFFAILVPIILNNIIAEKVKSIPCNYENELKIMSVLWDFEIKAKEDIGKFAKEKKTSKETQDLIDYFIDNQYKNIQHIFDIFENLTLEKIKEVQKLLLIAPSSYYNTLSSELSSKGYRNIADFYRYNRELKHRFCMFYRWKWFHTKETKVENFIKGEENIFYARSMLPAYFPAAVIIYGAVAFIILLILLGINHRMGYRIAEDTEPPGKPKPLFLDSGEHKILSIFGASFKDYLLALLLAFTAELKRSSYRYLGKIFLDEEEISAAPKKMVTFYIPSPEEIPGDLRVLEYLAYFSRLKGIGKKALRASLQGSSVESLLKKRFWHLKPVEQLGVLLEAASLVEAEVYVFHNLNLQMTAEGIILLKNKMEELAGRGAAVVLLTGEPLVFDLSRRANLHYEDITREWNEGVRMLKEVKDRQKEKKETPVRESDKGD